MALLNVDKLSVHFGDESAPFRAVDRISYSVNQGEVVGIVGESGSGKSVSKYNYLDIRDDRVLTYFNLRRGETKVFTVKLQATYAGNFILPAVQCEAMYDVNVQARSKAGRTTVSR